MTGMLAVGVLLIALGVVFLAVPLEQLQKVFRRMRSRIGTKIGGAVLVAAGIALACTDMDKAGRPQFMRRPACFTRAQKLPLTLTRCRQ